MFARNLNGLLRRNIKLTNGLLRNNNGQFRTKFTESGGGDKDKKLALFSGGGVCYSFCDMCR